MDGTISALCQRLAQHLLRPGRTGGNDHHFATVLLLPAAHVLAGHHVVPAKHVGTSFGEAGAVAFVGAAGKLALFSAHQPIDFIFSGLMTMRTVQRSWLFVWPLVEKFALIHKQLLADDR